MWEVVGYECQVNDEGDVISVTLYAVKPYKPDQGTGKKARRVWYRAAEIGYMPVLGDQIMIETETRGKYEIVTDIIKF